MPPQLLLGQGSRDVAWVVAGGFYPSFGDKSTIRTEYASQLQPRYTPSLHMYGLPHRASFNQIHSSWRTAMAGGTIAQGTSEVAEELEKSLIGAGARYKLLGHHAWWSAGTKYLNINNLAQDLYRGMIGLRPNVQSAASFKEASNILYDRLISGFSEFEDSRGYPATKKMIDTITENSLEGANLDEYVTNYWNTHKRDVDVSEEEWSDLLNSGLFRQLVEYEEPGDSLSDANKIDVRVMIQELNNLERYRIDATESLISTDASLGGHGVLRKMNWENLSQNASEGAPATSGTPEYAWIEANRAEIQTNISNHFIDAIQDDFNPVIRNMVRAASNPPNIPTPEQLVRDGAPQAAHNIAYTSSFWQNADPADFSELLTVLDRIVGGTGAGLGGAAASPLSTGRAINPTAGLGLGPRIGAGTGGRYARKSGKEGKKRTAMIRFILHSISNLNALGEDFFYQAHRVSDRNRFGDAFYAMVPMSQIIEGDPEWPSALPNAAGDVSPAYEYRTTTPRSPLGTLLLGGPNATLALIMHKLGPQSMTAYQAREINLYQTRTYITKEFHGGIVQQMNDRSILSNTNAESVTSNKHAFTVSYAPTDMIAFFTNFTRKLSDGLSSDEAKKIGEAVIAANNYKLINPLRSPAPHKFWALPYLAFEDSLERKADELYSWYNENAETSIKTDTISAGKVSSFASP